MKELWTICDYFLSVLIFSLFAVPSIVFEWFSTQVSWKGQPRAEIRLGTALGVIFSFDMCYNSISAS